MSLLSETVANTLKYADLFGYGGFVPAFKRAADRTCSIAVPGIGKLTLRPGSDWLVFDQVLIEREYRVPENLNPRFIIDAGANGGLATAYFAATFPNALIYAIEPDPENFELLVKNTQQFPNVQRLEAAIWPHEAVSLGISNPGAAPWARRVAEESGSIRAVTISALLRESNADSIDILKLDIEGTELDLLRGDECVAWLLRCQVLLIELHDRLAPGCSMELYRRLAGRQFTQRPFGGTLQIDLRAARSPHSVRDLLTSELSSSASLSPQGRAAP